MKIGLDFDGVIADSERMKQKVIKDFYDIDVPLSKLNKEGVMVVGKLGKKDYDFIQDKVYGTKEYSLQILPVRNMKKTIISLQKKHELVIVTSRGKVNSVLAEEWLSNQGLSLLIRSVGRGREKTSFCKDLDVFIDNDMHKIIPLIGSVKFLFHFNPLIKKMLLSNNIISVPDWESFSREIRVISVNNQ